MDRRGVARTLVAGSIVATLAATALVLPIRTFTSPMDRGTAPSRPSNPPPSRSTAECANPRPAWIWCDDFERDRLGRYFEYQSARGSFVRASRTGLGGSVGMRARWGAAGQVAAGALHLAFGRTPSPYFRPVDSGTADYREIYWRVYLRNEPGWTGGGGHKFARATVFASPGWAQAVVAHLWTGDSTRSLTLDPASGTDMQGSLVTRRYNDFANLRWLGAAPGKTPLFDEFHVGSWHCVEVHVRLNDPGQSNGIFEYWVNGGLEARRADLNWLGSYGDYGINAIFLENYWNGGAPRAQERYFDNFVVSTRPIGCTGDSPQ